MSIARSLGIGSSDDGTEFPLPKKKAEGSLFAAGDPVIVTTFCEDIALHGLTGTVSSIARTGTIIVIMDADKSRLPFLPRELGHHF